MRYRRCRTIVQSTMKPIVRKLLLVGAVALVSVAGAVAVWVVTRPPTTATLRVEPHLDGRHLTIVGVSDLPDGTKITWSVWNDAEADRTYGLFELPAPPVYSIYTDAVLSAGRFEVSADLTGWPAGPVTVWAAFDPGPDQPPETIARVGEWGERLSGPGVIEDSGGPRLLSYTTIELPAN